MNTRKAEPNDAFVLSDIAYKSKAYWGYSDEFLEACKEELTITEEDIIKSPMYYVIEKDNQIIGFDSFKCDPNKLENLFINPEFIGQGIGKQIWQDILHRAKDFGIIEFTIDSDPYAEGFYLKMGAVRIGSIPSTVFPDRDLPLMKVEVK
ncbi:GNAT family N-acetyltransferase [Filobacillus milosensis]|uniref:GNAT family N-acetyltransferase n=1 Tax=Filobacillus milosensis TaxID=94137 RepID=A0A4Y8IQX8_9BACI|nr:GNAT family N-acetyltransferase [Filobacillus milosensis]TFB22874.1 GNAT family N-acetyltransferase [Filobacillus milosensis]